MFDYEGNASTGWLTGETLAPTSNARSTNAPWAPPKKRRGRGASRELRSELWCLELNVEALGDHPVHFETDRLHASAEP